LAADGRGLLALDAKPRLFARRDLDRSASHNLTSTLFLTGVMPPA
jgi:hypothetical protein